MPAPSAEAVGRHGIGRSGGRAPLLRASATDSLMGCGGFRGRRGTSPKHLSLYVLLGGLPAKWKRQKKYISGRRRVLLFNIYMKICIYFKVHKIYKYTRYNIFNKYIFILNMYLFKIYLIYIYF